MSNDQPIREEVRLSFSFVRSLIHGYSGLYPGEDLTRDVLRVCDDMTRMGDRDPRLQEARHLVEDRCRRLAQATDRFAARDPALIAVSRAQAVAAIDVLQDAVFRWRKAHTIVSHSGGLLRRKSA